MEVKITSEELVPPSSPTPQHLRTFELSFLDQLAAFPHAPVILFYPANPVPGPRLDVRQKIDLLKKSLSRTLARFYPLAGKIRDCLYVECDDVGARFVEAGVNMSLTQFLTDPGPVLLNKLIPCELTIDDPVELTHPVNIQVNVFQCGGLAVAMCNTHKLHDGNGLGLFSKEWAAFARGDDRSSPGSTETPQDLMAAAKLFPANDHLLRDLVMARTRSTCKRGTSATKRFLFTETAIESLRARGMGSSVTNPTRVEAVSGFLWKSLMAASEGKNNGLKRPSTFTQLVNIRRRMHPPLSESSIGNLVWTAIAYCENTGTDDTFPSLVSEIRGAISVIDGDSLWAVSQDRSFINDAIEAFSGLGSSDTVDHNFCSSWGRFGFYDTDFGWGSPLWVSSVGLPGPVFLNLVILVATKSGDGIEAWVTLDEQEMALFEDDPELRSFASVNPSPLTISAD